MAALAQTLNEAGIVCWLCTDRPAFLFAGLDPQLTLQRRVSLDFGLVQHGWRTADATATLAGLNELWSRREDLLATEAAFLRRERIDLVVGDIPPLAFEAAARAGVPSVAMSNFDWPFIYRNVLGGVKAEQALARVERACAHAGLALRLPFSSRRSMASFPRIESFGLLTRKANTRRASVRRQLGVSDDTLLVLALFGGMGGSTVDFAALCAQPNVQVLAVEAGPPADNYRVLPRSADLPSLLPAVDLVLTKLGYSTLAECVVAGAPLLCTHRDSQPEDVLLSDGLREMNHPHQLVSPSELAGLDWPQALDWVRRTKRSRGRATANREVARRCVRHAFENRPPIQAVLDVGSNNILLLWGRREGERIVADHRASAVSALGRGMRGDRLTTAGLRRTRRILDRYIAMSRAVTDDIHVYATSAAREAANIGELADWLRRRHGVALRILSEEEEARCGGLAAASAFAGRLFTFDIGGGSTECTLVEDGEVVRWASLPVGLRRLESMFGADGQARRDYMRLHLEALVDWNLDNARPVGLGGTVCNLAAVKLGQVRYAADAVHGSQLSAADLTRYSRELCAMRDADIARLMPFEPSRARLVRVGVEWMAMLLMRATGEGRGAIAVCDRGMPFGYLMLLGREATTL